MSKPDMAGNGNTAFNAFSDDWNIDLSESYANISEDKVCEDIAVIGMALDIGTCHDPEEFWQALFEGEDFTGALSAQRVRDAIPFCRYLGLPEEFATECFLDRIDLFDPELFRIPPRDAALLDPVQRLFLITAWKALEDAGLDPERLSGSSTGVFAGYTPGPINYSNILAEANEEYADRAIPGFIHSVTASRLSHLLNLKGPAVLIDTACSSSLVAVHAACQSIRSGECSQAVAGGIKVDLLPVGDSQNGSISVASKDHKTRTFDEMADGSNLGEGVAAIVLKPLTRAVRDQDRILAVIAGSAVNQDGTSVGITAPNAESQEAVITSAWENAGIDPADITYIETHGTATKLGDPIEMTALNRAFRKYTQKSQFCAVGSVKANIGHLDCASGLTGLIKCILQMRHKILLPQIYFYRPNRQIDFIRSAVYVNDQLTSWDSKTPRICGVSSFGMSGTNCHVVLREYIPNDQEKETMFQNAAVYEKMGPQQKKREMNLVRCWTSPPAPHTGIMPGEEMKTPLLSKCLLKSPSLVLFSTSMSASTHSEVREHRIGDKNVLAGTVYVEMLHSAANHFLDTDCIQIRNLSFQQPMFFKKGQRREVLTVFTRESQAVWKVAVQSRDEDTVTDENAWSVHVQAKLETLTADSPADINISEIRNSLKEVLPDEVNAPGRQYVTTGPRWQLETRVWQGENEILCMVDIGNEFEKELPDYFIYPSMFDAAVNCSGSLNGSTFCLPYYYGSLRLYRRMPGRIFSHTVKKTRKSTDDGEINSFEIRVADEDGHILAEVDDYVLKKVGELQKEKFFDRKMPALHTIYWMEDENKKLQVQHLHREMPVLLVRDIDNYDRNLEGALRTYCGNQLYELVLCGWSVPRNGRTTYADPSDVRGIASWLKDFEKTGIDRLIIMEPECRTAETADDQKKLIEYTLHFLINLTVALALDKKLGHVRIELALRTEEDQADPIGSAAEGMARSLRNEYGRLKYRCLQYSAETAGESLVEELFSDTARFQVRMQGEERQIQAIGTCHKSDRRFALLSGGTYLITGGLGGLGMALAEAFAGWNPDIRLVLLSRRDLGNPDKWKDGLSPLMDRLVRLRDSVRDLVILSCDVADEEQMELIREKFDRIDGIVHAAGIAGGGMVIRRKWKEISAVLSPKTKGTWNVLKLAERYHPSFVVLFSSYSTILSPAGQADYVSANAFLDGLAHVKTFPFPLKVMNWGGWRECGLAFDHHVRTENSPVDFLSNEEGIRYFREAMECKESQVLIGQFNTEALREQFEEYQEVVRFPDYIEKSHIKMPADRKADAQEWDISVKGKAGPLTATEEQTARIWAKVLGLREIGYKDKFLEIGGDSLSATYLQKELDAVYPGMTDVTDIFVYSSIQLMAEYISRQQSETLPEIKTSDRLESMEKQKDRSQTDAASFLKKLAAGEIDISEARKYI